jgi:hypothetical protein
MSRTPGLLTAAVRGARWGLPWVSMLAISVSVAFPMTVAVTGGASAGDAPGISVVAPTPAEAPVPRVPGWSASMPAGIDRSSRDVECDTTGGRLLYIGLNSWIPAEPNVASCPEHTR